MIETNEHSSSNLDSLSGALPDLSLKLLTVLMLAVFLLFTACSGNQDNKSDTGSAAKAQLKVRDFIPNQAGQFKLTEIRTPIREEERDWMVAGAISNIVAFYDPSGKYHVLAVGEYPSPEEANKWEKFYASDTSKSSFYPYHATKGNFLLIATDSELLEAAKLLH